MKAKLNKNKLTKISNLPLKNRKRKKQKSIFYYTKPRVHILLSISKQTTDKCWTKFRYNLQFIKCTVCIVQDKVVKVVKLSGPVRLWDLGSGRLFVWEWSCLFSPQKTRAILCGDRCPHNTCKTESANMKSRWIGRQKWPIKTRIKDKFTQVWKYCLSVWWGF